MNVTGLKNQRGFLLLKGIERCCILLIIFIFIMACKQVPKSQYLFVKIPAEDSGLDFNNLIQPFESDTLNALEYDVMFNGGGVGIGDFNADGLQDIFFAGNMVPSKLYLNLGDFRFRDVTMEAGIHTNKWCTGVSIADINQDGLPDIYLSVANATGSREDRSNILFINQGNKGNVPLFEESGTRYGLADEGFSIQAAFFDYDKDGDLDCYILTNAMERTGRNQLRKKKDDGQGESNDRLYQNVGIKDGHPVFENVTHKAGIVKEGHGLGICITDLDQDGWLDVYCANDFVSNDLIWINNHDGTFTDRSSEFLKHTSYNSMGVDVQDFNNDGLPDICVVDMLPESEQRRKMMVMKTNTDFFKIAKTLGYQDEYVRNVLQVNQGKNEKGNVRFSEIGQLAGIHATDWSWAPLLADFDNDGLKDLVVSNGYRRDITNLDYAVYLNQESSFQGKSAAKARQQRLKKLYELPEAKLRNYLFKNKGGLTFEEVSNTWGFEEEAYSNGAAYADFDNDGDLDLVFNNIDSKASLYKNNLISGDPSQNIGAKEETHFVRVQLRSDNGTTVATGAKVRVEVPSGDMGYQENLPVRGYMSSVDPTLFFGLGRHTSFTLEIEWADGTFQRSIGLEPDTLHIIEYAPQRDLLATAERDPGYFRLLNADSLGLNFKHEEFVFDEFKRTFSLHQQYNRNSPGIAIGDVDGNGLDDIFIGADPGRLRTIFLQQEGGIFEALAQGENNLEDMGALIFDTDNDGDKDLYVVSGGSLGMIEENHVYNDRLYLNNGNGTMVRSRNLIPNTLFSGSVVAAADFDHDGDLDIFRGSRVSVGQYPAIPENYLFRNDQGVFADVTANLSEGLKGVGMVTSALWTDYNQDGWFDLVVAGEFMPITFFENQKGKLVLDGAATISDSEGWWNSIIPGDFDQDGDMDYIAGNLGLNSQYKATAAEPIRVYASDFDANGSMDPIFTYFKEGKEMPVMVRDVVHEQLSALINRRFGSYDAYSRAALTDLFNEKELEKALVLSAYEMRSSYIENKGDGSFELRPLPMEAQLAPVFGMLCNDYNNDGLLDVLLVGNSEAFETYTGPCDASLGTLLLGDGRGGFEYVPQERSGLYLDFDQKALATVNTGHENMIVLTNNDAETQILSGFNAHGDYISMEPMEVTVEIIHGDGNPERLEIGYSGGYLTQSSRGFYIPDKNVREVRIYNFSGKQTRTITRINT